VERPGQPATAHQVDSPFVLIGRDPGSDLVLDDPRVSRRHAVIQAIAGRLFCLDLQSRIQLHWENDDGPRTRGWLSAGKGLRVGPFRILVQAAVEGEPDLAPEWDPTLTQPMSLQDPITMPAVGLELPIRWGDSASLWRMETMMAIVGRSDASQLVLSDDSISKFHAFFVRTSAGLWVVDLQARQGIAVNGYDVRWAWLDEGDLLRIGQFAFRVRYDRPPQEMSRAEVPLSSGAVNESSPGRAIALRGEPRRGSGRSLAVRDRKSGSVISSRGPVRPSTEIDAQPQTARWAPPIEWEPRPTSLWQQQIQAMESFHNDMILMLQMFTAIHRESLRSVRDELDHVRQLTRELTELQKKLGTGEGPSTSNASVQAKSEDGKTPSPNPGGRVGKRSESRSRPTSERSQERRSSRNDVMPPRTSTPRKDAPVDAPSHETEGDDLQMHGDLCRRIAAIQSERQGYWRKILGTLNK
jgi:pSer/pThr/pTyr-binding forkhead associated (FHA) protein